MCIVKFINLYMVKKLSHFLRQSFCLTLYPLTLPKLQNTFWCGFHCFRAVFSGRFKGTTSSKCLWWIYVYALCLGILSTHKHRIYVYYISVPYYPYLDVISWGLDGTMWWYPKIINLFNYFLGFRTPRVKTEPYYRNSTKFFFYKRLLPL